jgi:hypothetical protein
MRLIHPTESLIDTSIVSGVLACAYEEAET